MFLSSSLLKLSLQFATAYTSFWALPICDACSCIRLYSSVYRLLSLTPDHLVPQPAMSLGRSYLAAFFLLRLARWIALNRARAGFCSTACIRNW